MSDDMKDKPDEYWRQKLTPEQYNVLRAKGTEPAFSGAFDKLHDQGMYTCAACHTPLFSSDTKFDSGSGWPSFWQAVDNDKVELRPDNSFGMRRTEVICATCGGHLGHLFDDGPQPTGARYCINSAALAFDPTKKPESPDK